MTTNKLKRMPEIDYVNEPSVPVADEDKSVEQIRTY
jgi:hypothetical protein